ncbi:protein of unknown function [Legionella fallonii LLAP-10]|uniref:Uncharacterized protein n=1 Tax=Legionella fallonii LLAP-10 TaxID=1212491 RepID=A0A098FZQ6_9GAMM|nr:protein of unknown function [Legionella fallonii LLAP-10]
MDWDVSCLIHINVEVGYCRSGDWLSNGATLIKGRKNRSPY